MTAYLTVYDSLFGPRSSPMMAELGGNRTATDALRPQTGFEDRPGHQAHAFRGCPRILSRVPESYERAGSGEWGDLLPRL